MIHLRVLCILGPHHVAACMMFPARFVPLPLLPSQYLLPRATCALCIFEGAQVGGCSLGLLRWSIALALCLRARAARALLVCLGRALPLERRFVVLDAVGALRVFVGVLPCHVNSQAVPRVEGLTTILTAGPLENALRRSRTRGALHVPQMLLQAAFGEPPLAVGALRILGRSYPRHFLKWRLFAAHTYLQAVRSVCLLDPSVPARKQ